MAQRPAVAARRYDMRSKAKEGLDKSPIGEPHAEIATSRTNSLKRSMVAPKEEQTSGENKAKKQNRTGSKQPAGRSQKRPAAAAPKQARATRAKNQPEQPTKDMTSPSAAVRSRDVSKCRKVFEKTYAEDGYIPAVANLGDRFAVAHPRKWGHAPVNTIDIFDFLGKLKLSITENITGLRRMTLTADRKLAVLCATPGAWNDDEHCINTFDPYTGKHLGCTPNFYAFGHPVQSFDARSQGEYCILGGDDDVTIIQEGGAIELSQCVQGGPMGIACGRDVIFVATYYLVLAFEVRADRLVRVARSGTLKDVRGISVTPDGEVTVLCKKAAGMYALARSVMRNGIFSDWQFKGMKLSDKGYTSHVSVGGDHVVIGRDTTVYVFSEEGSCAVYT